MKCIILMLILTIVQVQATIYSQNTRFTLRLENRSTRSILKEIEKRSEFRFFYSEDLRLLDRITSLKAENMAVEQILDELFRSSEVSYKVLENNLIIITPKPQEAITVTGIITDASTGESLPGVNVRVDGTTVGAVSGLDGEYTIQAPGASSVLVFSFVGYNTENVSVEGRTQINIQLIPELKQLDEVVVIGYGTRDKRNITTSISTVKSEELEKANALSADLALMGKTSGVLITPGSGDHSSRSSVRIRGVNSWNVADPLYVVDGVPVTDYGFGAEQTFDTRMTDIRGGINVMTMINPNDIETISVLKDASAAAIYGVRASNGVILITTKKGKSGKPVVQMNARYGIQNVPKKLDLLNTQQYTELYTEAYTNDGTDLPAYLDPANPAYLGNSPTYDWVSAYTNENAPIQDYGVRISGGSENTSYFFSGGYTESESLLFEKLKRYTFSTNISSQLNKVISTGFNLKLAYEKTKSGLNFLGADLTDAALTPPWQPIYDESNPPFSNGYMSVMNGGDRKYGTEGTSSNFLGMLSWRHQDYDLFKTLGNTYVKLDLFKGFSLKGILNVDWSNNRELSYNSIHINPFTPYGQFSPAPKSNSIGNVRDLNNRFNTLSTELVANYSNNFGKHNLDVLTTASSQKTMMEYLMTSSDQIFSEDPYMHFVSGDPAFTQADEYKLADGLVSYIGRISYNFNYTYYLDFTVRRDGSSRFTEDKRWGTFPAVSAAYRISNEEFMKKLEWLSDLKIRAGYGKLGNYETGYFSYLNMLRFGPHYSWGSSDEPRGEFAPGAYFPYIPNNYLTWETTATSNIGFDAILFKNLNVTVEYYHKVTSDLLQQANLPLSAGVAPADFPYMNIGKVENKGWEFLINYNGKAGEFTYSVGANLTTVKNEILETAFHDVYNANGNEYFTIQEGMPIGALYGYKVAGLIKDQDQLDNLPDDFTGSGRNLGDLYFQDIKGTGNQDHKAGVAGADGKVDFWDQTMIGNPIPKMYYGLNAQLMYKNFDMSAYFTGIEGRESFLGLNYLVPRNTGFSSYVFGMAGEANNSTEVLDRYNDNNTQTNIPRATLLDPNRNRRASDQFVMSSDYFRLQNLQVGYSLPSQVSSKLGISGARFWLGGSNLLTITKWKGLDPDNDRSPIPRIFNTGIDVKF